MQKYILNIRRILFSSIVILFFLMLPEVIFNFTRSRFFDCWDLKEFGILFALAVILSLIKDKKVIGWFLVGFAVFLYLRLNAIGHFGYFLAVLFLLPYAVLYHIFNKELLNRVTFKYAAVLLFFFIGLIFYEAFAKPKALQLLPNNRCFVTYQPLDEFNKLVLRFVPKQYR